MILSNQANIWKSVFLGGQGVIENHRMVGVGKDLCG